MNYKTLNYKGTEFTLKVSSYRDHRIAVIMYTLWKGHYQKYDVATADLNGFPFGLNVTLMDPFGPNITFMHELNLPGITKCFVDAGLAKPLIINGMEYSGHGQYPAVEINLEEIAKYDHAPNLADVDESDDNADDDVEWQDAADDEDVDALFRDLFGVEEDDD